MRRGAPNREARRLARHCATGSRGTGALLRSALVTGSIPGRAAESRAVAPAQTPGLSSRRGCRHEPKNRPKRVRRSSAKPPGRPSDPQTRTRDPENFRDPPAKVGGGALVLSTSNLTSKSLFPCYTRASRRGSRARARGLEERGAVCGGVRGFVPRREARVWPFGNCISHRTWPCGHRTKKVGEHVNDGPSGSSGIRALCVRRIERENFQHYFSS